MQRIRRTIIYFFLHTRYALNAKRIVQRQFNALLERCDLKHDRHANMERTVYSLRHTAICMRIILSEGQVNIFNLAKNAGTSVDQIERFYARNLPFLRKWRLTCKVSAGRCLTLVDKQMTIVVSVAQFDVPFRKLLFEP